MYLQGMSLLYKSGILEFLRDKARPVVLRGDSTEKAALQAARSAGYFECLEDLYNFRELYLDTPSVEEALSMDYGALDLAVVKGDLTKEEADELKLSR